ncbi:MAG: serine hydrolase, partial [Ruminococcus sp.]|nr:serine hydrolase [Candidatus Copronaster equi]
PEQVGVSSDKVLELLEYFEDNKMNLDSFMVIRDGVVACESYWRPNASDTPHDMYSLSKSITGTAIGIAWDEGIISLDTKIFPTYFPEKLEKLKGKQRKWAENVTIHEAISMRFGKAVNLLDDKEKTDWIDALLDQKIKYEPGTDWTYVSENCHLLAWILKKETGLSLTEFLTPRLYEPLGMKVPDWEKSSQNLEAGGWGLKLTAEDLGKIAILYLNKGVYDGKRIFSEEWYNKATYPYTKSVKPAFLDKTEYGYQTWIDHENNDTTIRFTGLFGQHMFMYPDYNAAVIVTASDTSEGKFIHGVYDYFPEGFIEKTEIDEKKLESFNKVLNGKKIDCGFTNAAQRNKALEKHINNRLIKLLPVQHCSTQGISTYFMWRKKIGYLNDLKFIFDKDSVAFSFKEKDSERTVINIGLNGEYIRNDIVLGENKLIVDAQGTWRKDGKLELFLYPTGRPQARRFVFSFNGKFVRLHTASIPEFSNVVKFNTEFTMGIRVGKVLDPILTVGGSLFETFYAGPDSMGMFVE